MSDEYLNEWIQKAEEDFEVAITLSRKKKRPTPGAVGFHCQQCIEKYLKAFLVLKGVKFPRIHDLKELHKLCSAVNPEFSIIGDLMDAINQYAVEFRYPGVVVTVEESKMAVKEMKSLRIFIRKKLSLDS